MYSKSSKENEINACKRKSSSFFKPFFQPKLTINRPNDVYEQEADAVADKVMRMSDPAGSNNLFFKPAISSIQRKCAHCEEENKKAQRKGNGSKESVASAQTEEYINSLSGGSTLNDRERNFFEPRMGYDLGNVKIHTNGKAAESAQSINALAYTSGNNIVFNTGQYSFDTDNGKRLLVHELTHSIQQNAGGAEKKVQKYDMDNAPYGDPQRDAALRNQAIPETPVANNCVVGPGKLNTDCAAYATNSWWLPFAYVNNATCACTTTPNSPKYNCIRKFLQDRLAAAPTWLKTLAVSQKVNDVFGTPQYTAYQTFVQTFLTPVIYRDHVDAYSSCCCPSGPATYPAWIGVTTTPIPSCSLVGWTINQFGNCEGTPGTW